MNQLIELAPGIAFFVMYFFPENLAPFLNEDNRIYWATGALMTTVGVQFVLFVLLRKPITRMMWVIFFAAAIFGTLTFVFQDPIFIKWKPTVTSWMLSSIFLVSHFLGRINILKWLLGDRVSLPDQLWRQQTLVFGFGFLLSGLVNIIVAYTFEESVWVSYRFISLFVWPVLFALALMAVHWYEHRRMKKAASSSMKDQS